MRIETKYLIEVRDFHILKSLLSSYFTPDPHGDENGYLVTSLYYDTADLKAYYDKIEGELIKTKWRLRMYNHKESTLRLEEKKKEGRFTFKHFHPVEHIQNLPLQPKLIIEYQRLAFDSGEHRVTLDYNLKFSRSSDLFEFQGIPDPHMILEIKAYKNESHPWLEKMIHDLRLTVSPFSKYAYGMKELYDL